MVDLPLAFPHKLPKYLHDLLQVLFFLLFGLDAVALQLQHETFDRHLIKFMFSHSLDELNKLVYKLCFNFKEPSTQVLIMISISTMIKGKTVSLWPLGITPSAKNKRKQKKRSNIRVKV